MREYSLQLPEGWDFPAISVVAGRDFPAITFLAWRIVKKLYGWLTNCSSIDCGIFCPKSVNFLTGSLKKLFSQ
jgi:hypothetical protein